MTATDPTQCAPTVRSSQKATWPKIQSRKSSSDQLPDTKSCNSGLNFTNHVPTELEGVFLTMLRGESILKIGKYERRLMQGERIMVRTDSDVFVGTLRFLFPDSEPYL